MRLWMILAFDCKIEQKGENEMQLDETTVGDKRSVSCLS